MRRNAIDKLLDGASAEEILDALARRFQANAEGCTANGFTDPLPRLVKLYAEHAGRWAFCSELMRYALRILSKKENPASWEAIVSNLHRSMMDQNRAAQQIAKDVRRA